MANGFWRIGLDNIDFDSQNNAYKLKRPYMFLDSASSITSTKAIMLDAGTYNGTVDGNTANVYIYSPLILGFDIAESSVEDGEFSFSTKIGDSTYAITLYADPDTECFTYFNIWFISGGGGNE